MPNVPPSHNAGRRRKTANQQTAQRQGRRLYATSCARWRADRNQQLNKQPLCEHCAKRGRVTPATEVDHINGRADRERDYTPFNYQSLCKPCHSRKSKSERLTRLYMKYYTKVYLISGASGSGKTTYVNKNQRRGDLVIDLDYLSAALSGMPLYDKPQQVAPFVWAARDAVIAKIGEVEGVQTAWIIQSNPTHSDINTYERLFDAEHIILKVDADECKRRIDNDSTRPDKLKAKMHKLVDHWHSTNT